LLHVDDWNWNLLSHPYSLIISDCGNLSMCQGTNKYTSNMKDYVERDHIKIFLYVSHDLIYPIVYTQFAMHADMY